MRELVYYQPFGDIYDSLPRHSDLMPLEELRHGSSCDRSKKDKRKTMAFE